MYIMELSVLKKRLTEIEAALDTHAIVDFCIFETSEGKLSVAITERLRRSCKRGKVWKSNAMLTALKNAQYGFDRTRPRSRGGSDGVFLLDRSFQPPNEMMRKIFDRFLDKPDPLVNTITMKFGVQVAELIPVRVVSHHTRLLGVLVERGDTSHIVLVDYDDTKDG